MNHWLTAPVLIPLLGGILQAFMGYAPIHLRTPPNHHLSRRSVVLIEQACELLSLVPFCLAA